MKYVSILVLIIALTACNSAYVTPKVYNIATEWCSNHDGLVFVRYELVNREYFTVEVKCKDGVTLEQTFQGKP